MDFLLLRTILNDVCSGGKLTGGGISLVTLELPVKDGLHGSAIAEGRYPIELLPSSRFMKSSDPWVQRYAKAMPHLIGVQGRTDIMMHWGNDVRATDGCPLVGARWTDNFIESSRIAFAKFYDFLTPEGCFITISSSVEASAGRSSPSI